MLQHEFEALTGKRVETEDYNSIIDPMYMSTDMDKQDFCKDKGSYYQQSKQPNRYHL